MARELQDFKMSSGDTLELEIEVSGPKGAAIVLTDPFVVWMLTTAPEPTEGEIKITKDSRVVGQASIAPGDAGKWIARIYILHSDSEELKPGLYYHFLRVVDASGRYTVMSGKARLDGSIPVPEAP